MKHILVTLPQNIQWHDYERELNVVADGSQVMRFKVPSIPKDMVIGKSRCYILNCHFIRGYMEIVGTKEGTFTCTTTGKEWSGKFIERSGPFFGMYVPGPQGFQGWRYLKAPIHQLELYELEGVLIGTNDSVEAGLIQCRLEPEDYDIVQIISAMESSGTVRCYGCEQWIDSVESEMLGGEARCKECEDIYRRGK